MDEQIRLLEIRNSAILLVEMDGLGMDSQQLTGFS